MNKILIRLQLILFTFLTLLSLLVLNATPPSAEAAPAECYTGDLSTSVALGPNQPVSGVDCSESGSSFALALSFHDISLEDDKCYYQQLSDGAFQIPPAASVFDLGSEQCGALASNSGVTSENTARCFVFQRGDGEYDTTPLVQDDFEERDCVELEGVSDAVTSFENGRCYVYSNSLNFLLRDMSCATLFAVIAGSGDRDPDDDGSSTPLQGQGTISQGAINADRNEIANCAQNKSAEECGQENPIVTLITTTVNVLSAGVGVILVGVIIVGGIQYSTSGANPNAVSAAKGRIVNAVIAFIMYALLWSFFQWLVPGGLI